MCLPQAMGGIPSVVTGFGLRPIFPSLCPPRTTEEKAKGRAPYRPHAMFEEGSGCDAEASRWEGCFYGRRWRVFFPSSQEFGLWPSFPSLAPPGTTEEGARGGGRFRPIGNGRRRRLTHPFTLRGIRPLAFGTPHTRGRKWLRRYTTAQSQGSVCLELLGYAPLKCRGFKGI